MDYAKESLRLHEKWQGKIEVISTVPVSTKDDLSLAYKMQEIKNADLAGTAAWKLTQERENFFKIISLNE